jgi:hypothetical protein
MYNKFGGKIPKKYTQKLSRKDKKKQIQNIKTAKKAYKNKKYIDRPKLKSYKNKKSSWTQQFHKKYPGTTSIKEISRKTKIPEGELRAVLRKGRGAYYSSGSRPNQTAESWGRARMYSYILGGPTRKYDKDITEKYKKQRIKLKKNKTIGGGWKFWNKYPKSIKIDPLEEEEWKRKQYSQLRKDRSAPSMRMKIKEDDFDKIAKKKFEQLELQRLEDLDDREFLTPINNYSNYDDDDDDELIRMSSYKSVNEIEPDMEPEIKSEIEQPHLADIIKARKNKINMKNIKNKFSEIYTNGIEIIIKFTKTLCEIINNCERLIGYNIHLRYNGLSLWLDNISNSDGDSIENIKFIILLLRGKYGMWATRNDTNKQLVEKLYDELNELMFNFKNGSNIMPYDPEYGVIPRQLYISNDYKQLMFEFSNFDNNVSVIMNFEKDLQEMENTNKLLDVMYPDTTISRCKLINTYDKCNNSCNKCVYL